MNPIYRHPELKDVDGMLNVEQSCFEPDEQMDRDDFVEVVNNVSAMSFVIDVDGEIAGMISCRTTDKDVLDNESYYEDLAPKATDTNLAVLGLAVLPKYQGAGLATELLKRAEAVAKTDGLTSLILDCRDRLIPFYEKYGFQLLRRSNSTFGDIKWFGMQKKLK
ncbi:GNAT family N-acetyltransferase [Nicoliella lavandulae]|uniref:GNAT family N-acetyltransferase n=1 Tax=Nicoliella lavandulae TaxID=3082954 RepID=A0ABU8SKJ0_9LACO